MPQITPEVLAVCAELLKLVSIIKMGLEPNEQDLADAERLARILLSSEKT